MKSKKYILASIASIVPVAIIIIKIADLTGVLTEGNAYPFNSSFFGQYSIYSSKLIYVLYNVIEAIVLLGSIFFAFKERWKKYTITLTIGLMIFLYPMFTNN